MEIFKLQGREKSPAKKKYVKVNKAMGKFAKIEPNVSTRTRNLTLRKKVRAKYRLKLQDRRVEKSEEVATPNIRNGRFTPSVRSKLQLRIQQHKKNIKHN